MARHTRPNRWRLLQLIIRFYILRLLFTLRLVRDFPYAPFRPAEYGGGGTGSMATPSEALAFMQRQKDSGSTAWYNLCEKLCRSSYALPGMYESAEAHGKNVPGSKRYDHASPSKGDIILYLNGGYGHIVVATGNGWECWTNDYTGKGKVGKADARDLVSWCGARSWYVADAWWSNTYYTDTHSTTTDPGDDEPVTDAEIQKIAEAVWKIQMNTSDGKKNAGSLLGQTYDNTEPESIEAAVWNKTINVAGSTKPEKIASVIGWIWNTVRPQ